MHVGVVDLSQALLATRMLGFLPQSNWPWSAWFGEFPQLVNRHINHASGIRANSMWSLFLILFTRTEFRVLLRMTRAGNQDKELK